jgi:hypothetical protein
MTVIASCGHRLTEDEDLGQMLAIASYNRENRHSIEYVAYCNMCANEAYKQGSVLLTDEEMTAWLNLDEEEYYEYNY